LSELSGTPSASILDSGGPCEPPPPSSRSPSPLNSHSMSESTSSESSVDGGWVTLFPAHGLSVTSVEVSEPYTGPGSTTSPAVRKVATANTTAVKRVVFFIITKKGYERMCS
jgi:hypothetical protein